MTLLIAGHETTAAVLTWTVHCLVQHPHFIARLQQEVLILVAHADSLGRSSIRLPLHAHCNI